MPSRTAPNVLSSLGKLLGGRSAGVGDEAGLDMTAGETLSTGSRSTLLCRFWCENGDGCPQRQPST